MSERERDKNESGQQLNKPVLTENITEETVSLAAEPTTKKLSGKKLGVIGAVATVILALVIGISIYNSPANRLSRQLDLGHKYLIEQNYEQAIVEFDKAIQIDPMSAEAYLGKAEAYVSLGDYDSAIETLKKGYEATDGNTDIMDMLVEAYLGKAESCERAGDYDGAIKTLEEGYKETSKDKAIRKRLVEYYLIVAEQKARSSAYAESLKDYDRLLELDKENEKVIGGLSDCLNKYLDVLMSEKRYDEIRVLAAKYKNVAAGVDFDKYLSRIEELEKIKAANDAFMQKVYDLMAMEDYDTMYEVDGSEEAEAMVERMEGDRYIYLPNGDADQTGTGTGIYTFGEGGYYFYYGNYINGSREGNGATYLNTDGEGNYSIFTGQWKEDAPNGPGEKTNKAAFDNSGSKFYVKEKGNLINGLWDGMVERKLTFAGVVFDESYSAVNGVPTEDRTAEFVSRWGNPQIGEDDYIYAYDYDARSGRRVWAYVGTGETLGVEGFTD